jgi:hypothetical protein
MQGKSLRSQVEWRAKAKDLLGAEDSPIKFYKNEPGLHSDLP